MTPEHLTNEELAGYLSSTMSGRVVFAIPVKIGDEGVEFKRYAYTHLAHEAARRLRNSIPKPVVEVDADSEYIDEWYGPVITVNINGRTFDVYKSTHANYAKALGMEGDSDDLR